MIRPAQQKDIKDIVTLSEQLMDLHHELDPEYYNLDQDYTVKIGYWAEQHLNSPSQFILVSETTVGNYNKITGFISGYIKYLFPWYKIKNVGHISFLVIEQNYQKKGVGRELEEAAKNWFLERNLKYIEVYTNEKNLAGMSAWNSYGYQPFNKFLRKKIIP